MKIVVLLFGLLVASCGDRSTKRILDLEQKTKSIELEDSTELVDEDKNTTKVFICTATLYLVPYV